MATGPWSGTIPLGGRLKFWSALCDGEQIDRNFFCFAIEDELEAIRQQCAQHLLMYFIDFTLWRSRADSGGVGFGFKVIAIFVEPFRSAGDISLHGGDAVGHL